MKYCLPGKPVDNEAIPEWVYTPLTLHQTYQGHNEVDIRYCCTEKMLSDILNKLNKGSSFNKDRVMLMNVPVDYDDRVEFVQTNPGLLPQKKG